ncbi:MAG: putative lyase [candidate division BRC1 bacterium ADurb.BinA364]|nr:MAG: putative lyase [candidate division BRC1 bacterium ADurb.BinA364]
MNAIQHVAFNCIDRKAQERFYTQYLGFRRARVFNAGQPNEFVMLRLGSACLELFDAKPEDRSQRAGQQKIGFKHIAFEVDDLESKVAQLRQDGVQTKEIVDCSRFQPGMRVCFLEDPEGNVVELMEGYADQSNPPAL